jgi:hypothetical protein
VADPLAKPIGDQLIAAPPDFAGPVQGLADLDDYLKKEFLGDPAEQALTRMGVPEAVSGIAGQLMESVSIPSIDVPLRDLRLGIEVAGLLLGLVTGNPILAISFAKAFSHDLVTSAVGKGIETVVKTALFPDREPRADDVSASPLTPSDSVPPLPEPSDELRRTPPPTVRTARPLRIAVVYVAERNSLAGVMLLRNEGASLTRDVDETADEFFTRAESALGGVRNARSIDGQIELVSDFEPVVWKVTQEGDGGRLERVGGRVSIEMRGPCPEPPDGWTHTDLRSIGAEGGSGESQTAVPASLADVIAKARSKQSEEEHHRNRARVRDALRGRLAATIRDEDLRYGQACGAVAELFDGLVESFNGNVNEDHRILYDTHDHESSTAVNPARALQASTVARGRFARSAEPTAKVASPGAAAKRVYKSPERGTLTLTFFERHCPVHTSVGKVIGGAHIGTNISDVARAQSGADLIGEANLVFAFRDSGDARGQWVGCLVTDRAETLPETSRCRDKGLTRLSGIGRNEIVGGVPNAEAFYELLAWSDTPQRGPAPCVVTFVSYVDELFAALLGEIV